MYRLNQAHRMIFEQDIVNDAPMEDASKSIDMDHPVTHKDVSSKSKTNPRDEKVLILHVGPQKTGTTSIQINAIGGLASELESDGYQIIDNYGYRLFDKLKWSCRREDSERCHKHKKRLLGEFYNRTMESSNEEVPRYTMHSNEEWSLLPHGDFYEQLVDKLFEPWDMIHIIIFYRPFMDWLPSMYSQYRKYKMAVPTKKYFWKQVWMYPNEQMTFAQYVGDLMGMEGGPDDALATYDFFKKSLDRAGKKYKMHMLDTYAEHGAENEFLCNLPGATKSCQHISNSTKKYRQWNKVELPLDLDHVVVEAYQRNLVNMERHYAAVALKEKLQEMNITMDQLPRACLSPEEGEWILNRAMENQAVFLELYSDVAPDSEKLSSRTFSKSDLESKLQSLQYCRPNSTAVLELDWFVDLFRDCRFHTHPHHVEWNGEPGTEVDEVFRDLGCEFLEFDFDVQREKDKWREQNEKKKKEQKEKRRNQRKKKNKNQKET